MFEARRSVPPLTTQYLENWAKFESGSDLMGTEYINTRYPQVPLAYRVCGMKLKI